MEQTSYFQIAIQPFQSTLITPLQLHLSRAALIGYWRLKEVGPYSTFKVFPGRLRNVGSLLKLLRDSKSTIETLQQRLRVLLFCLNCWLWTGICQLGLLTHAYACHYLKNYFFRTVIYFLQKQVTSSWTLQLKVFNFCCKALRLRFSQESCIHLCPWYYT